MSHHPSTAFSAHTRTSLEEAQRLIRGLKNLNDRIGEPSHFALDCPALPFNCPCFCLRHAHPTPPPRHSCRCHARRIAPLPPLPPPPSPLLQAHFRLDDARTAQAALTKVRLLQLHAPPLCPSPSRRPSSLSSSLSSTTRDQRAASRPFVPLLAGVADASPELPSCRCCCTVCTTAHALACSALHISLFALLTLIARMRTQGQAHSLIAASALAALRRGVGTKVLVVSRACSAPCVQAATGGRGFAAFARRVNAVAGAECDAAVQGGVVLHARAAAA